MLCVLFCFLLSWCLFLFYEFEFEEPCPVFGDLQQSTKNLSLMTLYNLCYSIGCSFKFILKVDVEESIVNLSVCRVKTKQHKKWG
jgi:hypothetical protein